MYDVTKKIPEAWYLRLGDRLKVLKTGEVIKCETEWMKFRKGANIICVYATGIMLPGSYNIHIFFDSAPHDFKNTNYDPLKKLKKV